MILKQKTISQFASIEENNTRFVFRCLNCETLNKGTKLILSCPICGSGKIKEIMRYQNKNI